MDQDKRVVRKNPSRARRPVTDDAAPADERSGSFASIFGALKDTVTIAPGTNLTDPVDDDWNAGR